MPDGLLPLQEVFNLAMIISDRPIEMVINKKSLLIDVLFLIA
jgi:hypothetical protein